ncbi:gastrula zinc finger protein XlCGF48.2-like isoform X2 [Xenopus laevis]|uniref:Gastrula zinc finger protein XlCGF48.2-like isoform X2 n=1 Tax=Xenopus laevis TaxID=8355 RepID=A0A8J0U7N5_XENLA|nr:gastrula zinc finger protein XlCGF48.2-like isoform X2 [Xenopus laevis]
MTIKKDKKKMTERIVNHALEIIFLLTGEEYIIMKKNAPQSIHLLTGEVHIKSGDAAVYFSTEEWEYIERHKESYNDVMMETLGSLGIPTSKTSGKIAAEVALDKDQKEKPYAIRRLNTEVQEIGGIVGPGGSKPGFEPDIDQNEPCAVICVDDKEEEICINGDSGEINEVMSDIENKGEPFADSSLEDTMQIICVNADSGESSVVDILEESQPATCISDEVADDDTDKNNSEVATEVEQKVKQLAVRCLDDEDEEVFVSSGSGGSWSRRMSEEYQTTVCMSHELAKYESSVFHGLQADNSKGNLALWKRGDTIFASQSYQCKENTLALNEKFDYSSDDALQEAMKHSSREKTIGSKVSSGKSGCEYYALAEDTPFNCNVVNNPYVTTQQMAHTDDTLYECTDGEKHLPYDSIFSRHQIIHTKEEPCASADFDKCFTDSPHEATQYLDSSGEKPFSCNDCGQCFTRRSSLLRHSKFHSGDKPYTCHVCGKCFSNKSHLVAHRRIHEGEKPYACPECGKCFANRSYLSVHKRTHTGEKPYSCPECGKRFTAMQSVVRHRRSHTGEKPYACGECGKRFTRRSCLNRHNRSHMRVKPFPCSECGQCFTNKALLDAHKITHTGVKLYSCTECGKCFTQMAALIAHHRSHIEENP